MVDIFVDRAKTVYDAYLDRLEKLDSFEAVMKAVDGEWDTAFVMELGQVFGAANGEGWKWGRETIVDRLQTVVKNKVEFVYDLKFAAAEKALRLRSFTVAGIENMEILEGLREVLIESEKGGNTFDEFRDLANDMFVSKGFAGLERWHLQLVFRNNLFTSYHVGRYEQMMDEDVREEFPLWEYNAIIDGATRPSHAAMNGKRFMSNDPIWDKWYPPNGHNCRCGVSAVSKYEMEDENIQPTGPPPMGVEPDFGWERNAGKDLVWLEKWQEGKVRGMGVPKAEAKAGFVPAKTVAEAEEWAKDNNAQIAHKKDDIIKIMTNNSGRYTERDIAEYNKLFENGTYSEATDEMKINAFNAAYEFYSKNPNAEKIPIIVYRNNTIFSFGEGFIARYDDLHKYIEFNNEKQISEILKAKSVDIGEENVGFVMEKYENQLLGVFNHEYGHYATSAGNNKVSNKIRVEITKYLENNYIDVYKNISIYAAENNSEFLAEIFALSKHPDYNKFPASLKAIVGKYIK